MSAPMDVVLQALRTAGCKPRRSGNGWEARCPAHEDREPSLSIAEGNDGRALLHCFAGCEPEAIVAGLGLDMRDLMPRDDVLRPIPRPRPRRREAVPGGVPRLPENLPEPTPERLAMKGLGAPSRVWVYCAGDGSPLGFAVARYDGEGGKTIRPWTFNATAGVWISKAPPPPRPLYGLERLAGKPEVPVLVVEGEKAADAAAELFTGWAVVTSPGGSSAADKADWSPLAGRTVTVWPDADAPGERYARNVKDLAAAAGAESVAVVNVPADFPAGWDLADIPPEGWNTERLAELLNDAETMISPAREARESRTTVVTVGGEWPALEPLPETLPPVEPFPPELLPDALRPWVEDIADRMQCPVCFPAVGTMVALAAVVGRQVSIRPKRRDNWTVVPNLWGAVVARPSLLKSPALAEPMKMLDRLEARARERYEAAVQQYQAEEIVAEERAKDARRRVAQAVKSGKDATEIALEVVTADVEKPRRRRYYTSDGTVEKLGELLRDNPRGLLIFRDELVGWLRSLDHDGREGSRAFFLEAWNGTGRFTFDRIGRGTIEVEAACLSVLGGIQPGPLSEYLAAAAQGGAGDDGLLQRLQLLVWPDVPKAWRNVDREPDRTAGDAASAVFERLDELDAAAIGAEMEDREGVPWLRFDTAAQEVFDEWRATLERRLRSDDMPPALEAHLSKYRSLMPSLALLLHLADHPGGGPVDKKEALRAAAWCEYLESHARRLYAQSLSPELASARELARRLKELPNPFRARDVYRSHWRLLDRKGTAAALEVLENFGYIRGERTSGAGRPTIVYTVNPAIGGDS